MTERHLTRTAVFVVLERDGKLLFLRRKNTGWADGKLTVPSGHVDKGHTVRQAAVTEVKEEAGVAVREEDLEFLYVHYIRDTYTNFYFKATAWEGEPIVGEPDLCSEILWIEKDNLPNDVVFHVRDMLEGVARGEHFSDSENDPG